MIVQAFPERLRNAREKRNLSQRELAKRCNLSLNQVSRYENSVIEPSLSAIQALSRELGVSADYLLGFTEESGSIPEPGIRFEEEQELLQTFRREGWQGVIKLGAERLSK